MDDRKIFAGKFELLDKLGEGGAGIVYKALHTLMDKIVAIKVLKREKGDEASVRRFQQEARAVASLQHPNIVAVLDFGLSEYGQYYMVMEYLQGVTLDAELKKRGALTAAQAKPILMQVLDAVEFSHSQGVLHRDLKPSNIMIYGDVPDNPSVKVLDFGTAKLENQGEGAIALTQTGDVVGTPSYMSPEQAYGRKIDQASDIYSLGCIICETLAGSPPFVGNAALEILMKHVNDEPPTLSEASLGREFDSAIEAVVARCLKKEPGQRYASVKELKKAFEAAISNADSSMHGQRGFSLPKLPTLPANSIVILAILVSAAYVVTNIRYFGSASTSTYSQTKTSEAQAGKSSDDGIDIESARIKPGGEPTKKLQGAKDSEDIMNAFDKTQISSTKVNAKYLLNLDNTHIVLTDKPMIRSDYQLLLKRTDITDLVAYNCDFRDDDIRYLVHLPLQRLVLSNTYVTDRGLKLLAPLAPSLIELHIDQCTITDQGLAYLRNFLSLQALHLSSTKITDRGLAELAPLQQLRDLSVCFDQITDVGAAELVHFPKLDKIGLGHTKLTDAGLAKLGKMKLRQLDISNDFITDIGIQALQGTQLEELKIPGTQITDRGLMTLAKQKRLLSLLILYCPKVSDGAIDRLQNALPSCNMIKHLDARRQ